MKPRHIEVLVVGAGPVGMLAALQLARDGMNVRIIDQAPSTCGHSYACALHGRTLKHLAELGLDAPLIDAGHKLDRVAFYEGSRRTAEIPFVQVVPEMPMVLVLSQADLENILEEALRDAGVRVMWNHRIADLRRGPRGMMVTLEQREGTAVGYDVPRWETVVKGSFECETQFVLGCDGRDSTVRRLAGIQMDALRPAELFVVYEFDSTYTMPDELRVVLNPGDVNVLWPLPEGRFRWGFQWTACAPDGVYPEKERTHAWCEERPVAQQTMDHLALLLRNRAPWFDGAITSMDWAADVQFEPALARQFGNGRCWLAGDAAHQTGPVGVQSMNVGMREGLVLARQVKRSFAEGYSVHPLREYEQEFRPGWQRLLGLSSEVELSEVSQAPKVQPRVDLVECLPAYGDDLDTMLSLLGFRLQSFELPTPQRH